MREHLAFLIDENLSPELAKLARAQGFRASHATWVRLAGKPDYHVAAFAVSKDLILVTNDIDDFQKLYRQREHHPGVVFLSVADVDSMDREAQRIMFEAGLRQAVQDEPLNEAIYVRLEMSVDGRLEVVVDREPLTRS